MCVYVCVCVRVCVCVCVRACICNCVCVSYIHTYVCDKLYITYVYKH